MPFSRARSCSSPSRRSSGDGSRLTKFDRRVASKTVDSQVKLDKPRPRRRMPSERDRRPREVQGPPVSPAHDLDCVGIYAVRAEWPAEGADPDLRPLRHALDQDVDVAPRQQRFVTLDIDREIPTRPLQYRFSDPIRARRALTGHDGLCAGGAHRCGDAVVICGDHDMRHRSGGRSSADNVHDHRFAGDAGQWLARKARRAPTGRITAMTLLPVFPIGTDARGGHRPRQGLFQC